MQPEFSPSFWERFNKTTGITGGIAVIMTILAASLDGGFDIRVFALSLGALFLCWVRTWVLVPIHLRDQRRETDSWNRYLASDWKFVDSLSDLSGSEIDALRDIFKRGADSEARAWLQHRFSGMSSEDLQHFIRFYSEEFVDSLTSVVDEDGRLRPVEWD